MKKEKKMNRSLEKDKENLLMKFNELMSQRGIKSKEEVMKQLFEGEDGYDNKNSGNNKSMADCRRNNTSTNKNNINENVKEEDEYNDFQKEEVKEDNIFVTNLPKESLMEKQET